MKFFKNKKLVGVLMITIFALSIAAVYLVFRNHGYTTAHPFPICDEVYQAVDPNTQEPVIRLVSTIWTGGDRGEELIIMFRSSGGSVWYLTISSSEYPHSLAVFRGSVNLDSEVTLIKTHSLSSGAGYDLFDWSTIDRLDAKSAREKDRISRRKEQQK